MSCSAFPYGGRRLRRPDALLSRPGKRGVLRAGGEPVTPPPTIPGTGNTLNANQPIVRRLILDSPALLGGVDA